MIDANELEAPGQLTMPRVLPPQPVELGTIVQLSNRLKELQASAEQQERRLEATKASIKEIAEKFLPDMMSAIGLTELRLVDGSRVTIAQDYFANVSKARANDAFAWLRHANMGSVIKKEYAVQEEDIPALESADIEYTVKESIHPSTLKALVREQIEAGAEFPRELFGVHVLQKAVLK